jgi:hypothetical protein
VLPTVHGFRHSSTGLPVQEDNLDAFASSSRLIILLLIIVYAYPWADTPPRHLTFHRALTSATSESSVLTLRSDPEVSTLLLSRGHGCECSWDCARLRHYESPAWRQLLASDTPSYVPIVHECVHGGVWDKETVHTLNLSSGEGELPPGLLSLLSLLPISACQTSGAFGCSDAAACVPQRREGQEAQQRVQVHWVCVGSLFLFNYLYL